MSEQIPIEVLEAARLRLKRRVAIMIIHAMTETGVSFETIDKRLDRSNGWAVGYVTRLMEGTTKDLDMFSDLCVALGFEPEFSFRPIRRQLHEIPEGTMGLSGNDITISFSERADAEMAFDTIEALWSQGED